MTFVLLKIWSVQFYLIFPCNNNTKMLDEESFTNSIKLHYISRKKEKNNNRKNPHESVFKKEFNFVHDDNYFITLIMFLNFFFFFFCTFLFVNYIDPNIHCHILICTVTIFRYVGKCFVIHAWCLIFLPRIIRMCQWNHYLNLFILIFTSDG